MLGPPASSVCHNNLQARIQLCSKLGLPLHRNKLEDPSTYWAQVMLQARLPAEKRERYITLLSPLLVTSTSACKMPPPPPRLERLPIA